MIKIKRSNSEGAKAENTAERIVSTTQVSTTDVSASIPVPCSTSSKDAARTSNSPVVGSPGGTKDPSPFSLLLANSPRRSKELSMSSLLLSSSPGTKELSGNNSISITNSPKRVKELSAGSLPHSNSALKSSDGRQLSPRVFRDPKFFGGLDVTDAGYVLPNAPSVIESPRLSKKDLSHYMEEANKDAELITKETEKDSFSDEESSDKETDEAISSTSLQPR